MFVRHTTSEDIDNIEFNEYVLFSKETLKIAIDFQQMFSFIENGVVVLIVGYFEFYPHCFKCGIIGSKYLKKNHLRFVHEWMIAECNKQGCIRLETEGINNPVLSRFHKFFGFVPEVVINNGGYIKWVLLEICSAEAEEVPHRFMMQMQKRKKLKKTQISKTRKD